MYLVLDCETATLPFVKEMNISAKVKKQICLAKPLVYDIGWTLCDRKGNILKKASYLVQETFFVPSVFNTAYYAAKRNIYMEKLAAGDIVAKQWNDICKELEEDCKRAKWVAAFNAQFDFKRAIPYTERYIKTLYSANYNDWENKQKYSAKKMAEGEDFHNSNYDNLHFCFRGGKYEIVDVWQVAVKLLANKYVYKALCADFPMLTASGLYFRTSAEAIFRFIGEDLSFNEAHTALEDATIETAILAKCFATRKKIDKGITAFPFRELGTTIDFISNKRFAKKITPEMLDNIIEVVSSYIDTCENERYKNQMIGKLACLKEAREKKKNA